jgi:hypothetical protein
MQNRKVRLSAVMSGETGARRIGDPFYETA